MAMVTWDDGGGVGLDPPPGDVESLLAAQLGLLQQQLSVQNAQIELLLHNTTPQAAMEAAGFAASSTDIAGLPERLNVDFWAQLRMVAAELGSPSEEAREEAVQALAEVLHTPFDSFEGAQVGRCLRGEGAIGKLASLLDYAGGHTVAHALWCLGNLCSDELDPSSNETKRALMLSGAHASILRCLGSSDPQLLVYVCGLCLNLSSELEWSVLLFRVGAVARLEQLVAHEDQVVSRYATTTLLNVLALLPQLAQGAGGGSALAPETIEATKMLERKRKSEAFAKNRAFRVMGTAVRAMSEEMRKKISTNAAKRQLGMRVEPIIPREKGTGRRLTPEEIEKKREEDARIEGEAATTVQCAERSKKARRASEEKRVEKKVKVENNAATKVQCVQRGKLSRAETKVKLEVETHAATTVQSTQRGKKDREEIPRLQAERKARVENKAATQVQAVQRGKEGRRAAEAARRERAKAANKFVFGRAGAYGKFSAKIKAQKAAREKAEREAKAATNLQKVERGKLSRKQTAIKLEVETKAATELQCVQRGKTSRKETQIKWEVETAATTKVQAVQRGKVSRAETAVKLQVETEAATAVQSAERAKKARKISGELREERKVKVENHAATKVQAVQRGKTGRIEVENLRVEIQHKKEESAATTVQCAHRQKVAIQEVGALRQEKKENNAATTVQSIQRQKTARLEVQQVRVETKSAIKLQSAQRGKQGRRDYTQRWNEVHVDPYLVDSDDEADLDADAKAAETAMQRDMDALNGFSAGALSAYNVRLGKTEIEAMERKRQKTLKEKEAEEEEEPLELKAARIHKAKQEAKKKRMQETAATLQLPPVKPPPSAVLEKQIRENQAPGASWMSRKDMAAAYQKEIGELLPETKGWLSGSAGGVDYPNGCPSPPLMPPGCTTSGGYAVAAAPPGVYPDRPVTVSSTSYSARPGRRLLQSAPTGAGEDPTAILNGFRPHPPLSETWAGGSGGGENGRQMPELSPLEREMLNAAKHDVERGYSTLRGYERSRNERKISRDEGITHFLGQQNIGSRSSSRAQSARGEARPPALPPPPMLPMPHRAAAFLGGNMPPAPASAEVQALIENRSNFGAPSSRVSTARGSRRPSKVKAISRPASSRVGPRPTSSIEDRHRRQSFVYEQMYKVAPTRLDGLPALPIFGRS